MSRWGAPFRHSVQVGWACSLGDRNASMTCAMHGSSMVHTRLVQRRVNGGRRLPLVRYSKPRTNHLGGKLHPCALLPNPSLISITNHDGDCRAATTRVNEAMWVFAARCMTANSEPPSQPGHSRPSFHKSHPFGAPLPQTATRVPSSWKTKHLHFVDG